MALVEADLPLDIHTGATGVYWSGRPYNAITGTDDNMDGRQGNDRPAGEGRNARRGSDFFSVDLSVRRVFRVGRGEVGAVASVYNVFNRDNFVSTSIVGNLQSTAFGEALSAFPKRQAEIGLQVRF